MAGAGCRHRFRGHAQAGGRWSGRWGHSGVLAFGPRAWRQSSQSMLSDSISLPMVRPFTTSLTLRSWVRIEGSGEDGHCLGSLMPLGTDEVVQPGHLPAQSVLVRVLMCSAPSRVPGSSRRRMKRCPRGSWLVLHGAPLALMRSVLGAMHSARAWRPHLRQCGDRSATQIGRASCIRPGAPNRP